MARHAEGEAPPDSFPSVLGPRPAAKAAEELADHDEPTLVELALPKLPPPKLAVFGPPSPGAAPPGRSTYQLGKVLGTGGLATVYEAFKEGADGFRKRVAVKRIHPHLAQDARVIELFGDEARLLSAIHHPNVCQVLDFVDDGSASFIVMELLEGLTLMHAFRALRHEPERLGWPRHQLLVARVIAGVAEGLHAAHELKDEHGASLQVVHRDVTPHNLFVLKSGVVKVTDFGVARARSHVHQTVAGVTKGKLAYMAPEQLQGHALDRRADIFSLGVVLWELLTGERLFQRASDAKTLAALRDAEVPDPRSRQRVITPAIAAVALKALHPDPDERFNSAREMSRALDRAIAQGGDSVSNSDLAEWVADLERVSTAERVTIQSATLVQDQTSSVHTADLQELTTVVRPARRRAALAGPRRVYAAAVLSVALAGGAVLGWLASRAPSSEPAAASVSRPAAPASSAQLPTAATEMLAEPRLPTDDPLAPAADPLAPAADPLASPASAAAEPAASAPSKLARAKSPSAGASATDQPAPAGSAPAPAASGFVLVAVTGAPAEILIEGRTYAANRPISLPVGPHRITVVRRSDHAGSREIEVNVRDGATSLIPITIPEAQPQVPSP